MWRRTSLPEQAALLVALTATGLRAQSSGAAEASPAGAYRAPDWTITLGAGAIAGSRYRYMGSNETQVLPLPFFDIRWRNRLFLSPVQGLGANLLVTRTLRAGLAMHADLGRDESDGDLLRGMGDIDVAPELRAFAEVDFRAVSLGLVAHRRMAGEGGILLDLSAAYTLAAGRRLMIRLGPSATWMDGDYAGVYFGVSPGQALRSDLAEYRPDGGIRDVGVNASILVQLGGRWGLMGFLKGTRLVGDASRSPVVAERSMGQVGTFLLYRF